MGEAIFPHQVIKSYSLYYSYFMDKLKDIPR